ncbi:hypothetical protein F4553_000064 [Allocatelliglobosispora scoriae]|uniref:Uncharacterized protein n=1 Tax=Allocatelliglobosispora scoriae TaxID=643052 RepID=A0A841BGC7_9ACTN|nr:hypothetical protein [Allocatelliglobosispora scoriae]MBB5866685.1 hypothetical protein [Allocatelliglobosispora scoriae]
METFQQPQATSVEINRCEPVHPEAVAQSDPWAVAFAQLDFLAELSLGLLR